MKYLLQFIAFLFITTLAFSSVLQAGIKAVGITDAQGVEQILYNQSHALLIGASNYTEGWPVLPNVKKDIETVEKALMEHGFNVTKVIDPNGLQLENVFDTFIQDYGLDEGNRLLIYFAGHGHTIKKKYGEVMGYLVPVDAPNPEVNRKGFLRTAMPIQTIELYAKRIDSKHALFLFDSCFSGSIFSLSRAIPTSISFNTSRPVRQFITSGGAEEQVPDISIFRRQFIAALNGEGDSNRDGYLTGSELGLFLTDSVINYSKNSQHPQYGKIRNPHLDKGDFVFVLPQEKAKIEHQTRSQIPPQQAENSAFLRNAELMFWDTIKESSNPNDFKAYLEQFPDGRFAPLAKIRSAPLSDSSRNLVKTDQTTKKKEKKDIEIHRLLMQAQAHIDAYRLITPEGGNAIFSIQQILEISPDNQMAKKKLNEITGTYLVAAQKAIKNNDIDKAKLRYRHGLKIAREFNLPDNEFSVLNQEIEKHLAQEEQARDEARETEEIKRQQQELTEKKKKKDSDKRKHKTEQEAKSKKESRGQLTVVPDPWNASVRILNIAPLYQPGMQLKAGRYHIEVKREGYKKTSRWVQLRAGDSKNVIIKLKRSKTRQQKQTLPPPREHKPENKLTGNWQEALSNEHLTIKHGKKLQITIRRQSSNKQATGVAWNGKILNFKEKKGGHAVSYRLNMTDAKTLVGYRQSRGKKVHLLYKKTR